jgi:hypothetical protein
LEDAGGRGEPVELREKHVPGSPWELDLSPRRADDDVVEAFRHWQESTA